MSLFEYKINIQGFDNKSVNIKVVAESDDEAFEYARAVAASDHGIKQIYSDKILKRRELKG